MFSGGGHASFFLETRSMCGIKRLRISVIDGDMENSKQRHIIPVLGEHCNNSAALIRKLEQQILMQKLF